MGESHRTLLGKQPARLLMLDLSPPFNAEVGEELCDSLENFLSLACNLCGPSRIPFLGLMVINQQPELMLPFSYVRNNFQHIQTAISEVRSLVQGIVGTEYKHTPNLYQGLAEVCTQYRRQLLSLFQGGVSNQLEIILVTCQKSSTIKKLTETALTTLDTENLKRIQLLCLSGLGMMSLDDLDISNSQSSSLSEHSNNSSITNTGLVEIVNIEQDSLCLQNFFSSWLIDSGTDSEHLHLILPPMLDSNIPLTIKCDLQERVLQPAQLPFFNQFTIHSDSSTMKMVFPSTSKAMGISVPIYKLQVTGIVPVNSVCDSLVFGMPMVARATSCWKIDWDDLEKNQQLFRAVCHVLNSKEQAFIAQLLPHDNTSKSRNGQHVDFQPLGHFVLIPSTNGTLLIKNLAVQELMLPYYAGSQTEEPIEDCVNIVTESMDQLEVFESYNPLNHPSNLFECLKMMGKKSTQGRQQKRPLQDSTVSYTNKVVSTKTSKQSKKSTTSEDKTVTATYVDPADTPLGKRILSKVPGKAARRMLYTVPTHQYNPEEDNQVFSEENTNIHMFKSGRTSTKNLPAFPTSL